MIKILMHGCNGKMGQMISGICSEDADAEIVAGIDIADEGAGIENIEKAMEPLYTTRPDKDRSGMGFTFMEAFMDQVTVESEVGKGTIVHMKKIIGR